MQKRQQILAIVVQVHLNRGLPANPDHFVLTVHTSDDSSGFENGIIPSMPKESQSQQAGMSAIWLWRPDADG